MEKTEREQVGQRVANLLRQGFLNEPHDPEMQIGSPIPVMHPDGGQHSWFVPLVVGHRLVGFAQILTTLEPLRFSSFQRRPGKYDDCPEMADWTDVDRILARAARLKRENEQLGEPVLTYDQNPTRLAWRVSAGSSPEASRSIFVAGTAVYEDTGSRGWG